MGEVRAEREGERSGCCGGGSDRRRWCWWSLENLFMAMFLDMPTCLLVAPPSLLCDYSLSNASPYFYLFIWECVP